MIFKCKKSRDELLKECVDLIENGKRKFAYFPKEINDTGEYIWLGYYRVVPDPKIKFKKERALEIINNLATPREDFIPIVEELFKNRTMVVKDD